MCFCAREKNQREWRESRQASFDPQGDRDEAWQNRLHYRFSSRSRRFIFEAPQFSWRRRVVMRITFVGESPHILANVSVLVSLPITSEKNQSRTQAPESQTWDYGRASARTASLALRSQDDSVSLRR